MNTKVFIVLKEIVFWSHGFTLCHPLLGYLIRNSVLKKKQQLYGYGFSNYSNF